MTISDEAQVDRFWLAGSSQLVIVLKTFLEARGETSSPANIYRLLKEHPTFESLMEAAGKTSKEAAERLRVFVGGGAHKHYASFTRVIEHVLSPLIESAIVESGS